MIKNINENIKKIEKPNTYKIYKDFMQHDPLFSEMKEGLFPYKMRLVCAKNYDYSQRLALILSSHGTYYLLDCFKTLNEENYDRIALMCNSYGKMNDAINDMEILSSGFGGYDAYLVPREEADKPFQISFKSKVFMHGDDDMNGIFSPLFTISAEVAKDPEHSYILEVSHHLYSNTNGIEFEDVEDLKTKILPLDEKIELHRKLSMKETVQKIFKSKER